jgi:hypothetical protein
MESVAPQPEQKKPTLLIIIGIVVAVLCCCYIGVIAVLTLLGPTVSNTFESIQEELPVPDSEEFPVEPPDSEDFPLAPPSGFGGVPSGGLGDEILRADTWNYVILTAISTGCGTPAADTTSIEVFEDPDDNGRWVERWTVICEDGSNKGFYVTFTPNTTQGGTDISVTTVP